MNYVSAIAVIAVNGILYPTFHEAAIAMGLAKDGNEQRLCLNEAALHLMPHALRKLFVTILIFIKPPDALALFNEFEPVRFQLQMFPKHFCSTQTLSQHLIEDFTRRMEKKNQRVDKKLARNLALEHLEAMLAVTGKSLHMFKLPLPSKKVLARRNARNARNALPR